MTLSLRNPVLGCRQLGEERNNFRLQTKIMTKIPLTGHGLGKKVLKCAAKEYVSKS